MTEYKTLISINELNTNLGNPNWAIIDCHFELNNLDSGREKYTQAHIPGAVYAHLDEDLSGPVIPGKTSRHPLPDFSTFAAALSNWGIDQHVQVVVYDDRGGAIAGRLWWMLKWLGHENVAVLDGSFSHWRNAGLQTKSGTESRPARKFTPKPNSKAIVDVGAAMSIRSNPEMLLIDSRSIERYRGVNETLDPVAGHIPGAVSLFFGDNLDEKGHFKSKDALRERFEKVMGEIPAKNTIFYCGSGVTAAHNILAVMHAGLGDALLYPGSWSEWITDPDREIETGE